MRFLSVTFYDSYRQEADLLSDDLQKCDSYA